MGLTKSYHFNAKQNKIAEFAKAFAHPARVAIVEQLVKRGNCVCGDLVDVLPLSQSTISQHLKELKRIGIIKGDIEGQRVCYCIDAENWVAAKQMMTDLFGEFGHNCC